MSDSPPHEPEVATPSAALPAPVEPRPSTLRRDIVSSYVLTLSRILVWAAVSAIVFRRRDNDEFAILALLRGTITLVGYTALGLGPAMVRVLSEAARQAPAKSPPVAPEPAAAIEPLPPTELPVRPPVLSYTREVVAKEPTSMVRVFATGAELARFFFLAAAVLTILLVMTAESWIETPGVRLSNATAGVFFFGAGVAIRLLSEPASSLLQARDRLALDNAIVAGGEILWLGLVFFFSDGHVASVAGWWCLSCVAVGVARTVARFVLIGGMSDDRIAPSSEIRWQLIRFGGALTIAQLADFLYAPTDYLLINHLLRAADLASYAPLVQIDGALLLLVSGLALALFPHASLAHAAGDRQRLRRLYVQASSLSALLLAAAGAVTWLLSPWLFEIWLGEDLPESRALLPLVLIHTVLGGSSAVGRSILLGMGRVKAFTTSVLVAGVANVILSAIFATLFGLKGIVLGTIVVVTARCAVWMPWYVLRSLHAVPSSGIPAESREVA